MPTYNLIAEYEAGSDPDCITMTPYWIIAVVGYEYPLTANRRNLLSLKNDDQGSSVSFDNGGRALSATKPILIIDSDCVSLTVSSSKGTHISQLQAVLKNSGYNYLASVFPNDWVFAWMVNSEKKYHSLRNRISSQEQVNLIDDGLKFVGRVQDMGKTLMQSPDGLKTVQYNLMATGFKELDSQTFFDPHLAMKIPSFGQWLLRLGIDMNDIFQKASEASAKGEAGIPSDKVIPLLLNTLIGTGITPELANPGGGKLPIAAGLSSNREAPMAYVVPEVVGKLLGVRIKSKLGGMYSYADILESIIGLQKYSDGKFPSSFYPMETGLRVKLAVGLEDGHQDINRHVTSYPLKGSFQPVMPMSWSGKTVWTILNEFLNPAVNEMYTALRLTPRGVVAPTLVVRQLPFNTKIVADAMGTDVTSFMEVPRWKAHSAMIRVMDVGRSDQTRFNFVHIYGQPSVANGMSLVAQMVLNPPFRDEEDIKRNGLTPYLQTVNCNAQNLLTGPRKWMLICSDFLMGQQLTLNGSCSMAGVTAPICCGDNFEFDDTVYHIESVQHSCSISEGKKTFTTHVKLSHGVRSDSRQAMDRVPALMEHTNSNFKDWSPSPNYWSTGSETVDGMTQFEHPSQVERVVVVAGPNLQNPDLYIYSGIGSADNANYDPGITKDVSISPPKKGDS